MIYEIWRGTIIVNEQEQSVHWLVNKDFHEDEKKTELEYEGPDWFFAPNVYDIMKIGEVEMCGDIQLLGPVYVEEE